MECKMGKEGRGHQGKADRITWFDGPGEGEELLKMENQKHNASKPLGCSRSSSRRDVYSNTGLPQETRKISKNLTIPKDLKKE